MTMIERGKIEETVVEMLKTNLALKGGETLLVLTDVPSAQDWTSRDTREITKMMETSLLAKEVAAIAKEWYADSPTEFYPYPALGRSGAELPKEIEEKMIASDVVIAITTYSLTHTEARENACRAGSRIASMPGFSPEMFYAGGVMSVDYAKMREESKRIAEAISRSDKAVIHSPGGTDIELTIKGREPVSSLGDLSQKGTAGNLPGGEVYVAPVEGTAHGRVVIEKKWDSTLPEDMILIFKAGRVADLLGGGNVGDHYRTILSCEKNEEPHLSRRNCAEFGVGLNPNAKRPDNVLEAEKIRGTVHIAIGDNSHFGGTVKADIHQDFVIFKPTVEFDGKVIIEDGNFLF
jgi:leucyl aminopeptidase (aminopeptidase T)